MVVTIVFLSLTFGVPTWILMPPQKILDPSDVVIVVDGAPDGRHELGAKLVEQGVARNFVVSNSLGAADAVGFSHCQGADKPDAALESWCLHPDPITTTGEALTMKKLAAREEWTAATVVTRRTHARRVHTMFHHCTQLDVAVVYVDFIDMERVKRQVLHEIGGYIEFWLTDPC